MSVGFLLRSVEMPGFAQMQAAINRLQQAPMADLMDNVGSLLETQTVVRIAEEKTTPDGKRWKPLEAAYAAWKAARFPNSSLLILRGHMRDSITYNVGSGLTTALGDGEVEVGSSMEYAGEQDDKRQFVGMSDDNQDEVEQLTIDWFEKIMG